MAEVGDEAVGYVDAGARTPAQHGARGSARLRSVEARAQFDERRLGLARSSKHPQRGRRVTERSDHVDVVAHVRGVATQCTSRRDEAERGDRDGERTRGRVATDEGDVVWEPFGGLCSTAVAALRSGRECYSAELLEDYFVAACGRLDRESRMRGNSFGVAAQSR